MDAQDAIRGQVDAELAWRNHTAGVLTTADIYAVVPVIDACGLYLQMSKENAEYVRAWNQRLRDLLVEHGLPPWAPAARLPKREDLSRSLQAGTPVANFEFTNARERSFVRRHVRYSSQVVRIARVTRDIVAVELPSAEVDVLDVAQYQWVARVHL